LGALSVSDFASRRDPFEGALIDASFVSAANAYRPPVGALNLGASQTIGDYVAGYPKFAGNR
jgi:hypothetical protein